MSFKTFCKRNAKTNVTTFFLLFFFVFVFFHKFHTKKVTRNACSCCNGKVRYEALLEELLQVAKVLKGDEMSQLENTLSIVDKKTTTTPKKKIAAAIVTLCC